MKGQLKTHYMSYMVCQSWSENLFYSGH